MTVLHIGGEYHGERRDVPVDLVHGRLFELAPKIVTDGQFFETKREDHPIVLNQQRYMLVRISWEHDIKDWFAFHESLGVEQATSLREIFGLMLQLVVLPQP